MDGEALRRRADVGERRYRLKLAHLVERDVLERIDLSGEAKRLLPSIALRGRFILTVQAGRPRPALAASSYASTTAFARVTSSTDGLKISLEAPRHHHEKNPREPVREDAIREPHRSVDLPSSGYSYLMPNVGSAPVV